MNLFFFIEHTELNAVFWKMKYYFTCLLSMHIELNIAHNILCTKICSTIIKNSKYLTIDTLFCTDKWLFVFILHKRIYHLPRIILH